MSRRIIPKGDDQTQAKGTWWRSYDRGIYFRCPNGHIGSLDKHQIYSDGDVRPSVDCPREGCDFHEHISLEDWGTA